LLYRPTFGSFRNIPLRHILALRRTRASWPRPGVSVPALQLTLPRGEVLILYLGTDEMEEFTRRLCKATGLGLT
jgi:hypothetical protein